MLKKIIRIFANTILVCGMLGVIFYSGKTLLQTQNRSIESASHPNMTIASSRKEAIDLKDKKPISILLAGLDSGAMMYEDAEISRTDALVVATLNPETKQTTLTSIPRDTWMPIDEHQTFDKVNHAYVYGGIKQTHRAIEQYLGIPIDYYLTVDMKAFIEGIDALEGLEITPNQSFDQNGSIFVKDEKDTFNGEQVMNYARMRKQDPDGDNGRQTRQRQIIKEMFDQYVSIDTIGKIPKIYGLYTDHVETNIKMTEMVQMLYAYQPAFETIRNIAFQKHQDVRKQGIYYMYIDEMSRNSIHKALTNNLNIEEDFHPIVYPLEQIPQQPYFETTDTNWDGIITHQDAPVPTGIYTLSDLEYALTPHLDMGY